MKITAGNNTIILHEYDSFDLDNTLDCGQAFRWKKNPDGSYEGISNGFFLRIYKNNDEIILENCPEPIFHKYWYNYFDFSRNYTAICKQLSFDPTLKQAVSEFNGIRILKQDPWEALCSFIISQNNNIPRIKGIIERFCCEFGDKNSFGYNFPDIHTIAHMKADDLAPIRAGFRAKYLIDAAQRVYSGEVKLYSLSDYSPEEARIELMKIKGVGPKVADCVLLYGLDMIETVPMDVWMKRVAEELYPDGFPACFKGYEGIAQQYLFHWRRNSKLL